jgi:hypothetical protein
VSACEEEDSGAGHLLDGLGYVAVVEVHASAAVDHQVRAEAQGHGVQGGVNPKTPVLQFKAAGAEQFYTTPVKTYFVPKIWERTRSPASDGAPAVGASQGGDDSVEFRE